MGSSGKLRFQKTAIPDVMLIEPSVHEDPRGCFFEFYRRDEFTAHGISEEFVQDNQSRSARGVLRGLHYQVPPHAQAKLVRVIRGEVFDVAVDLRSGSPTFGRWVGCVLSETNRRMLYIPVGFAHGLCVVSEGAEVVYKASDFYAPELDRGIVWSDPEVGITWPTLEIPYVISERDRSHPRLKDVKPRDRF